MGLFDKFKELTRKVSEVENNIYHEKRDYLEIYERNIELEREIAERIIRAGRFPMTITVKPAARKTAESTAITAERFIQEATHRQATYARNAVTKTCTIRSRNIISTISTTISRKRLRLLRKRNSTARCMRLRTTSRNTSSGRTGRTMCFNSTGTLTVTFRG